MTDQELKKAYQKYLEQYAAYEINEAYTEGKNPDIYRDLKKKDPDNRIPVPLAKSAVEDMTGYAGRDIKISYRKVDQTNGTDAKEDEYQALMDSIQDFNDDDTLLSELYQEMISQKEVYLLLWTSDTMNLDRGMLTPEYQMVTMEDMIVFYTRSLKPEVSHAIRFIKDEDEKGIKTIEAIIYYPLFAESYISRDGGNWTRNELGDVSYPYQKCPIVVLKMSREGGPIFKAEIPLIDAHDKGLSKTQNEIDRFNALIALFPGKVTKEFISKLEQMKAIDELGDYERWPEFLEKNLAGVEAFTNKQLDRLERLFHKTIKIPDMTSLDFAGGAEAASAKAYKLLGMEFKASGIEIYFFKAMYRRAELINDVINASVMSIDTELYTPFVTMKRNLPIDELQKAQIAVQLKGIVSDETLLKFMPRTIVEDPAGELERIKKQNESCVQNIYNHHRHLGTL
jgi:SPP1 family phage portal protein